jgi:hypothetical protein
MTVMNKDDGGCLRHKQTTRHPREDGDPAVYQAQVISNKLTSQSIDGLDSRLHGNDGKRTSVIPLQSGIQ